MLKLIVCNLVAVVYRCQSCKHKLQRHKIINVVSCSSEKLKTINLWPQKCEYSVLIIFCNIFTNTAGRFLNTISFSCVFPSSAKDFATQPDAAHSVVTKQTRSCSERI